MNKKLIVLFIIFSKIIFADYSSPDANVCNRGIDTPARAAEIFSASQNAICKYDVSSLGNKGVYILQIDGDYKVEISNDNNSWSTALTAPNWNYWTNKGPSKSMSPYYINLAPYLPANYIYFRISDNTPSDGNGARVLNAKILQRGYPEFYAGGAEPNTDPLAGDQSFLFQKNGTSDNIDQGRAANNHNFFVYKFDLPDDENNCTLFARVSGEYKIQISTNYNFSPVLFTAQNPVGDTSTRTLRINLSSILSQSLDNLIYFKMLDSDPTDGGGGNLKELWITPQISATEMTFHPYDEIETAFLWENNGSRMAAGKIRYSDLNYSFVYRFNFDKSNSKIQIETDGEFLFQGSSNGTDWVNLFLGPTDNTVAQPETLIFNPFTGEAEGYGAQSGIPSLVARNFDGWSNVFFLRVADIDSSDGYGAQVKSIKIIPPVTVTYSFDVSTVAANLECQPRPDDLAQMPGTTKSIIQGGMHTATPGTENFNKFFDSNAVGSFGTNNSYNGCGLLQDGISTPSSDTIILCQFDSPKIINEIHLFTYWGDERQFSYFELWGSTNGTSTEDYYQIGTALNDNYGTTNVPYEMTYHLAKIYDPEDEIIAENVSSLRLIFKNAGYNIEDGKGVMLQPGTPQGGYRNITGPAINEIDIIGIPEPFGLSFVIIILTFLKKHL